MVVSGHIVGSVPRRLKSSLPSPSSPSSHVWSSDERSDRFHGSPSLFSAFHHLLAQPARRKPTHTVIRACASRRQEVVTELGYHQRSAPLCAAGLVRHSGCVWPISASWGTQENNCKSSRSRHRIPDELQMPSVRSIPSHLGPSDALGCRETTLLRGSITDRLLLFLL